MTESRAERRRRIKETQQLHTRELILAPTIDTGATDGAVARNMLGLTQDVTDLTIVDLASGASTLVEDLLLAGANAYGVDHIYDMSKLDLLTREGVNKVAKNYENMDHPELAIKVRNSLERFYKSFVEHGHERYITGWMTNVPLPDNFADIVTSVNGLALLGKDFDLILRGVREGLRIAKPGSPLIMVPFHATIPPHTDYAQTHRQVLLTLKNEGYKAEIQRAMEIPGSQMLRMIAWKK